MNKIHADLPDRIETERLYLRPYQPGDGPLFFAASLRNRSHLSKYESENILMHLKDQEHAEAIIREMASDWAARDCFFIGIFEKATGEWVGQVYVGPTTWEPPEFSIGYVADVNHQGLGYITEAVTAVLRVLFENLHAHRVTADCHEDNLRSWRLLERCGFKREGHLRENKQNPDGSYHGDYLYGLLRNEYESKSI